MKKKLISLLCVASLLIGLLAGCGSSGSAQTAAEKPAAEKAASGTVQVGIVLPTKDEPRWLQNQAQFESILGDAGFTNQVMFSQGSSATEKTNVETLISKGISVQYVIDGKQSMTVFKDTRTLAADSVAMAMSILNGETPKTDTTYNNGVKDVAAKQTNIVVVTKDNVKAALIDSEYYDASDFTGL